MCEESLKIDKISLFSLDVQYLISTIFSHMEFIYEAARVAHAISIMLPTKKPKLSLVWRFIRTEFS